jgi:hypothetical protein
MLRRYIVRRLVAMPMRSPAALYNVSDLSFMSNMPPKSKTLTAFMMSQYAINSSSNLLNDYTRRQNMQFAGNTFYHRFLFCFGEGFPVQSVERQLKPVSLL